MDIAQFNKILGTKIKKANVFESQNQFKEAIRLWVEISEMTLGATKDRSLNVAYRSMLLKKTEQIVAHIRELKASIPVTEDYMIPKESLREESSIEQDYDLPKVPTTDELDIESKRSESSPTIVEESEIANLPIGFKEIKPKSGYKIITPHDPSIVQKRLDEADKMDEFFKSTAKKPTPESQNNKPIQPSSTIKLEKFSEDGSLVCFACGSQNPKNTEKCKDCGTPLS
jgi:hypothetical protein